MIILSQIIKYSKYDSIYSISTSISKNKIRKINSKNKIITDKVNDTKINFIILSFLKIIGKKLAQLSLFLYFFKPKVKNINIRKNIKLIIINMISIPKFMRKYIIIILNDINNKMLK